MKELVEAYIIEQFENIINTTYKRDILTMIKSDIIDLCSEISLIELEFLSENIYDYCCLMVNQIAKEKVMWYITQKNAEYYNQVSEENKKKFCFEFKLKPIQNLIKKYLKIIKEQK